MGFKRGLPDVRPNRILSEMDIASARLNSQFLLKGINPSIPSKLANKDVIVFLEYVQASTTIELQDANSISIVAGIVSPLDLTRSPLRIDGGLKIVGTVLIAKGFVIPSKKLEV